MKERPGVGRNVLVVTLWGILCLGVFSVCLLLPLHEIEVPDLFSRFSPWIVLGACVVLGAVAGVGGLLFQLLTERLFGLMNAESPFGVSGFVATTHVGGSVLIAGGLGNGVNCLLSSCDSLSTWTSPAAMGLGLMISTLVLSWAYRLVTGRSLARG